MKLTFLAFVCGLLLLSTNLAASDNDSGVLDPQATELQIMELEIIPYSKMYKDVTGKKYKVIHADPGGNIIERQTEIVFINEGRIDAGIVINGPCMSACAFYVELDPEKVCYTKEDYLYFHFPRMELQINGSDNWHVKYGNPMMVLGWFNRDLQLLLLEHNFLFYGKESFIAVKNSKLLNKCNFKVEDLIEESNAGEGTEQN